MIFTFCLVFGCDELRGPNGPEGPQGEKGDQGEKGATGENYLEKGSITLSNLHFNRGDFYKSICELIVWGDFENSGTTVLDNIKIHIKAYNELDGLIIVYYFIPYQSILAPSQKSSFEAEFICPQEPARVTFGYSCNVPIYSPALKRSPSPGKL